MANVSLCYMPTTSTTTTLPAIEYGNKQFIAGPGGSIVGAYFVDPRGVKTALPVFHPDGNRLLFIAGFPLANEPYVTLSDTPYDHGVLDLVVGNPPVEDSRRIPFGNSINKMTILKSTCTSRARSTSRRLARGYLRNSF